MNIPSFPTDSLYKFQALSGVFAAIFFFSAFFYMTNEVSGLKLKSEAAKTQYGLLKVYIEGPSQKMMLSDKDRDALNRALLKLKGEAKYSTSHYLGSVNRVNVSIWGLLVLALCGVAMAWLGFWRWYEKHQKWIDLEMENKANAVRRRRPRRYR